MPVNAIYLGVFWLFYYAIHSALATDRLKRFFADKVPLVSGWYRLLYSLFAGINFALLFWFHSITPSNALFTSSLSFQIIGGVFGTGALIIFMLAMAQYDWRFWVTNTGESQNELVTSGLNSLVRHPLYFAVILALIALVLVLPKWKNLIFAVITFLYIIIGALLEERKLINKYGRPYIDYRERVKMLIPFLI
ncbi:isoprenylcysteine carboxylmethyltransferase family protein [Cryomorpha ignava]|uniref:Isoprenylcysteine carboxylmethyltransferase family protein n=1 Tax=Cryomorpha ignava TaxID=101383 RepID=A0A7K3WMG2_9FLAO|nr:isoprenylcysteine carboxylmethyltransferase family protein [Cryomorpha ignava]NEN22664.1 isoprenylcysteine carboxylmethyltransferase family protein [Cryomorpha ignava]